MGTRAPSIRVTIKENPVASVPNPAAIEMVDNGADAANEHAVAHSASKAKTLAPSAHKPQHQTSQNRQNATQTGTPKKPGRSSIAVVHRETLGMHMNPLSNAAAEENDSALSRAFRDSSIKKLSGITSDRFLELSAPEQAALFEHKIIATPCSSTAVLRREFGRGIYGYFIFLQFLLGINVLLAIISVSVMGWAYSSLSTHGTMSSFFTAMYPASARTIWIATTSVIVAIPLLGGLLYPFVHRYAMKSSEMDALDVTGTDAREDAIFRSVTYAEKRNRRIISAFLFITSIVAQSGITYGIYNKLSDRSESYIAVLVALANNVLNFVQKYISKRLTKFELHRKVSTHRGADTMKLFTLKFANVIILYIIKAILLNDGAALASLENGVQELTCVSTAPSPCTCPLLSQGWTFLWLLVFDVAFSVVVEPSVGVLIQAYRRCNATRKGLSDYDIRLDFDVAEELVSVLYRQFIILLGVPVFPIITVLGVAAYIIEYYMDRVKLVRLCKKTVIREESMDLRLIVLCTALVSVAAAFSFPQGLVFMGSGYKADQCKFFA